MTEPEPDDDLAALVHQTVEDFTRVDRLALEIGQPTHQEGDTP